jgi:crotonobetainyl-CoA:carnitine CoA-transferase CaiB-like acyl-CoA transferase
VRNPVLVDGDDLDIERPAPLLGEHSEEILRELGYADDRIAALTRDRVVQVPAEEPAAGVAMAAG